MNWEKIKPVLWGAIGGAIALSIIGFAWGGWVTGGTAQEMRQSQDVAVGSAHPTLSGTVQLGIEFVGISVSVCWMRKGCTTWRQRPFDRQTPCADRFTAWLDCLAVLQLLE